MGIVSSIGRNLKEFSDSLRGCKSGINRLDGYFLKSERFGAKIPEIDRGDIFIQIVKQAINEALENSELNLTEIKNKKNIGLVLGTSLGDTISREAYTRGTINNYSVNLNNVNYTKGLLGYAASYLCQLLGIRGPSYTVTNTCVSGINAIAVGCQLIATNQIDICLVGGIDILGEFVVSGMNSLKALSKNEKLRPFEEKRDGIILGEGAGFLVLAANSYAKKPAYGVIKGYSISNDAKHLTSPDEEAKGLTIAISQSLAMSEWKAKDIDCIFCCGTGTKYNDASQSLAISKIWGEKNPFITTIKPYSGHTLGASGVIESIGIMVMMKESYIVPIGQEYAIDSELENIQLLYQTQKIGFNKAILMSSGFTGVNGALTIQRSSV